jgi:UDP-2,3-diacylglucosamine pyrophosphatase LpxH
MSDATGNPTFPARFATLLVVSDLHLGPGRDPRTHRYDPTDNFTADAAFAEFLGAHKPQAGSPALLVLNGDIFDFVRISDHPETDDDLVEWRETLRALGQDRQLEELRALHPRERRYGLRTDDYKSVWKLSHVAKGHRALFEALGAWNVAGGWVVFVKGNHDVELHWELVQKSIRREIAQASIGVVDKARILFEQDSLTIRNVYIEHGHRFESLTAVNGPATLPGGTELRLPLGSFVNRYVINDLEGLEPNLDNLKPIDNLLWRLVRRHPLKIMTIAWRSVPLLRRAFRPHWWKHWFAFVLYFITLVIPILCVILAVLGLAALLAGVSFGIPELADWIFSALGDWRGRIGVIGILLPYIVGFVRDVWPRRKPKVGENHFAAGVHSAIADTTFPKGYDAIFGVLGHTHQPDVQSLPRRHGADVVYINSGTWIGTWSEDRPELSGQVVKSFVRFDLDGDEYRYQHGRWDASAGRAVESVILQPREAG